jgi:hypothetical protein
VAEVRVVLQGATYSNVRGVGNDILMSVEYQQAAGFASITGDTKPAISTYRITLSNARGVFNFSSIKNSRVEIYIDGVLFARAKVKRAVISEATLVAECVSLADDLDKPCVQLIKEGLPGAGAPTPAVFGRTWSFATYQSSVPILPAGVPPMTNVTHRVCTDNTRVILDYAIAAVSIAGYTVATDPQGISITSPPVVLAREWPNVRISVKSESAGGPSIGAALADCRTAGGLLPAEFSTTFTNDSAVFLPGGALFSVNDTRPISYVTTDTSVTYLDVVGEMARLSDCALVDRAGVLMLRPYTKWSLIAPVERHVLSRTVETAEFIESEHRGLAPNIGARKMYAIHQIPNEVDVGYRIELAGDNPEPQSFDWFNASLATPTVLPGVDFLDAEVTARQVKILGRLDFTEPATSYNYHLVLPYVFEANRNTLNRSARVSVVVPHGQIRATDAVQVTAGTMFDAWKGLVIEVAGELVSSLTVRLTAVQIPD